MLNRYAFERNNPYRYDDPTGHAIPALVVAAVAILIAGTIIGLYNYFSSSVSKEFDANEAGSAVAEGIVGEGLGAAIEKGITSVAGKAIGKIGGFVFGIFTADEVKMAGGPMCPGAQCDLFYDQTVTETSTFTQPANNVLTKDATQALTLLSISPPKDAKSQDPSDIAKQINAGYAAYGVKNVAYINKHTGEVSIDKGKAMRAAVLAKAEAKRNK